MKKIELKSRKLLRRLFGCVSLTAMAFAFQACYGTGPDPFYDIRLTGVVRSKTTNLPIKGIKISLNYDNKYYDYYENDINSYGLTNEKGEFDFYAGVPSWDIYGYKDSTKVKLYSADSVKIHILDIDSTENGYFEDKIIFINPEQKDEIKIYVELENKQ
jgi:hypothetical protein